MKKESHPKCLQDQKTEYFKPNTHIQIKKTQLSHCYYEYMFSFVGWTSIFIECSNAA